MIALFVARCMTCGTSYTPARWALLELKGIQEIEADETGPAEQLECRNCSCGSTLAIKLDPVSKLAGDLRELGLDPTRHPDLAPLYQEVCDRCHGMTLQNGFVAPETLCTCPSKLRYSPGQEPPPAQPGIWCPVFGDNGCRHSGACVGSVCVAADRNEGPLLNKQTR